MKALYHTVWKKCKRSNNQDILIYDMIMKSLRVFVGYFGNIGQNKCVLLWLNILRFRLVYFIVVIVLFSVLLSADLVCFTKWNLGQVENIMCFLSLPSFFFFLLNYHITVKHTRDISSSITHSLKTPIAFLLAEDLLCLNFLVIILTFDLLTDISPVAEASEIDLWHNYTLLSCWLCLFRGCIVICKWVRWGHPWAVNKVKVILKLLYD